MAGRSSTAGLPKATAAAGRPVTVAAWFMMLFLAAGLLTALGNPALLASPGGSLIDGSWAASYQQAFDASSPLLEPATTIWAVLEYGLFRQGRPGVLVGSDGWLFSTEEFAVPTDDEAYDNLEANLELIAGARDRLESSGARLVVAFVPTKALVHSEQLGRYEVPALVAERLRLALAGLRERGIEVVDLREPLLSLRNEGGQPFLRTDTHWTPSGASEAAEEVARVVAERWDFEWLGADRYVTTPGDTVSHRGDLARFIPLGSLYAALGPADDELPLVRTASEGPANSDLFAEIDIPATLVGTSYSRDERWNFAGYLREELGTDVLLAAEEGQGPFEPMENYLAGEAFAKSPPELVIWEVPVRYLTESWQLGEE